MGDVMKVAAIEVGLEDLMQIETEGSCLLLW